MTKAHSPTILVLTTYPLVDPKHGGQIRAKSVVRKFQENGWSVISLAYVDEGSSETLAPNDKIFRKNELFNTFNGEEVLFINDLQLSKEALKEAVVSDFLASVPSDLDAIHVEQPWLWPLARAYKSAVNAECILIYGSANIESDLKIRILRSLSGDQYSRHLEAIRGEIDRLERTASLEADIIAAVSASDLDTIKGWGAKGCLVLAPNGVRHQEASAEHIEKWRSRFGKTPFLVYIASAHPPNFTEFAKLIGESLGCFPPDSRLVTVGSVTEHIYHQCKIGRFSSLNLSRLDLVFQVDDDDLAAIKHLAKGYFLPIPFGGGTNLKTAEALYSGKFVIGTTSAFRGFEHYSDAEGVYVCESPAAIHAAVRDVMLPSTKAPYVARERVDLGWMSSLDSLYNEVNSMIEGRPHANLG